MTATPIAIMQSLQGSTKAKAIRMADIKVHPENTILMKIVMTDLKSRRGDIARESATGARVAAKAAAKVIIDPQSTPNPNRKRTPQNQSTDETPLQILMP